MIHDIAIWKLVLVGFVLASFSFLVGFLIAITCVASGRAAEKEEKILDFDEQWKLARDTRRFKA